MQARQIAEMIVDELTPTEQEAFVVYMDEIQYQEIGTIPDRIALNYYIACFKEEYVGCIPPLCTRAIGFSNGESQHWFATVE